jgi:hypothetical protein
VALELFFDDVTRSNLNPLPSKPGVKTSARNVAQLAEAATSLSWPIVRLRNAL